MATANVPVVVLIVRPLIDVAVAAPRIGVTNVDEFVMATLPVPLIAYSPATPALSNNTRVVVPPEIVVLPIVIVELPPPLPAAKVVAAPGVEQVRTYPVVVVDGQKT